VCDSDLSLPPPAAALLSGLWMLGKEERVYQEFAN
jgi:hypothetical protein